MKKETKKILETMNQEDIYSIILHALFKLKDTPEYASLSELAYLLNGKSLMNLLEYYGGQTITIPTIKEFRVVVNSLLLYQYVNIEGMEMSQAEKLIKSDTYSLKEIRDCYVKMVDILNDYNIDKDGQIHA